MGTKTGAREHRMCPYILAIDHCSVTYYLIIQWEVIHGKEPREDGRGRRPSESKFRQGYIARAFHFLHRVEGQKEFGQELGLEKLNKHYAEQCFPS